MQIDIWISIHINSPDCHQAVNIVIDVMLGSHTVSVGVIKILASRLHSLSFLHPQDDLYYVFVPVFAELPEPVFYLVSDFATEGIQICRWISFLGNKFFFEDVFNYFFGFGRLELFFLLGLDRVLVLDGGCLLGHLQMLMKLNF